jgi:Beta-ketoacyl synthase, N-terminal domain
VDVSFAIKRWAAFAPGLTTRDDWTAWANSEAPALPTGDATPPLTEVSANVRRRLDLQGRSALQVAFWCSGEDRDLPVVYASRHGETPRATQLLRALALGEPLSPTSFGLSVHNAVGAQFSMIRSDPAPLSAIAGGAFSTEAGVLEAVGLLREGVPAVLLVVNDAPLPAEYAPFVDEPQCSFSWAWLMARDEGTPMRLSLQPRPAETAKAIAGNALLPHGLEVLRFFLSGQERLTAYAPASSATWCWSKGHT